MSGWHKLRAEPGDGDATGGWAAAAVTLRCRGTPYQVNHSRCDGVLVLRSAAVGLRARGWQHQERGKCPAGFYA